MKCSTCGGNTYITDTIVTPNNEIYRQKKCKDCKKIFYTILFSDLLLKIF